MALLRQRLDDGARHAHGALERWQHDAQARVPASDLAVLEQPLDPADVPARYRGAVERIDSGELDCDAVLAGDVDDEDARALSLGMDRRLQQFEQVGCLVRAGTSFEDACAQVASRGGR